MGEEQKGGQRGGPECMRRRGVGDVIKEKHEQEGRGVLICKALKDEGRHLSLSLPL